MREINRTDNTIAYAADSPDPNAGGACHHYIVTDHAGNVLLDCRLQHGPIKEAGVNGIQHVDLMAIVQDRIDCFQQGPFASQANEDTGDLIAAAIASDAKRTRRRKLAGVEGRSLKAAGVEK